MNVILLPSSMNNSAVGEVFRFTLSNHLDEIEVSG